MSDPDYILDIGQLRETETESSTPPNLAGRPWIGMRFDCCGVYTRIYRNSEGTHYLGHCPRCLKKVRLAVGPGGVSSRFFTAE